MFLTKKISVFIVNHALLDNESIICALTEEGLNDSRNFERMLYFEFKISSFEGFFHWKILFIEIKPLQYNKIYLVVIKIVRNLYNTFRSYKCFNLTIF